SSMRLAIENFAKLNASKKYLILGAMAELGAESIQEHSALVDLISKYDWAGVVLVGGDFQKVKHTFISFDNSTQAAEWWSKQNIQDAYLLIKGSRSSQMEKVIS